jgi:Spy/CpxP family protein refolding chaperone
MKLSLTRHPAAVVTLALAGALSLGAGGVALAQQAAPPTAPSDGGSGHHRHHEGIVAQALALPSLTTNQRTAIEQLVQTRHAAEVPVKQADARLLTALATQVEQASLDRQALASDVQALDGAASSARSVDRATLQQLHELLTPAQRGQLADALESEMQGHGGHGRHEQLAHMEHHLGLSEQQETQIAANLRAERQGAADGGHHGPGAERQAWLESFRTDSFSTSTMGGQHAAAHPGEHVENLMQAMLPVLTPTQRAQLATHLRHRAAHESST